jgi:hypothetical protein
LFLSGAEPTISEAGGEPARDISADVPCSDTVGVDGWLREMDDNDGWRENCFSNAVERIVERSVSADEGAASAFGVVVVVVSRRVLGRLVVVQSGDFVEAAVGVFGNDSTVVGVATIFCGRTCGFIFEGDTPGLCFGGTAIEVSSLTGCGRTFPCDEARSSKWWAAPDLDILPLVANSLVISLARDSGCFGDPRLTLVVLAAVPAAAAAGSSAVVLSFPELETKTFLLAFSGFEVCRTSFTFGPGLLAR